MNFSIEEPVRLLRKLHSINPKAKTHFIVRLPGDQMEIPPACATQGRKPNELEIHGEGKEALDNLAQTLDFYSKTPCEVEMVTDNAVVVDNGQRGKKKIKLELPTAVCQPNGALASLPFLAPDNLQWRLEVRFRAPNVQPDNLWISTNEVRRLIRSQPAVSESLRTLRQGNLEVEVALPS